MRSGCFSASWLWLNHSTLEALIAENCRDPEHNADNDDNDNDENCRNDDDDDIVDGPTVLAEVQLACTIHGFLWINLQYLP